MIALSYVLLAITLLLVTIHDLRLAVRVIALKAVVLAVQAGLVAMQHGEVALYWVAGLTLVIKGLAIPFLLNRIIRRIGVMRVIDSTLSTKVTLLIALTLMMVAHYATTGLPDARGPAAEALPTALTMVLIGLFLMVSRRIALTQVLGLLVMENGLFLAALATTGGLPVLVDVGVFFDVLVSVLVCGLLVYRINTTFASIDTRHMRRLRG